MLLKAWVGQQYGVLTDVRNIVITPRLSQNNKSGMELVKEKGEKKEVISALRRVCSVSERASLSLPCSVIGKFTRRDRACWQHAVGGATRT